VKRLVTLLFIICLFLVPLTAGRLFSVGFGSMSQLQIDLTDSNVQPASIIDVHNWATGFEVRTTVLGMNTEAYMLIQQGDIIDVTEGGMPVYADDVAQKLFGMVAVGFTTKSSPLTTLSFGAGTRLGMNVSPDFGVEFWAGDESNLYTQKSTEEFFSDMMIAYRIRLDLNIKKISFGLHYEVPSSGFTYSQPETELLIPDWSQGKIGAAMIVSL
jgi:hypothetical protein